MTLPGNGIFVVRGEMSTLMTAMRRGTRWNTSAYSEEEQDGLMKQFLELKQILNQIEDLRMIDPNVFLGPFLEVIRTEETTGAVTSLALSAVNKFLSYGLIDPTHPAFTTTVENIADTVTHARFMGTDQVSDGVTLMRVVEVLRTLMCNPEGNVLTNENVCEVMLSCFKICFEPRLNELLRRSSEQALKDMVLLLFMRLPQFSKVRQSTGLTNKFKIISSPSKNASKKRKSKLISQGQNDTKPSNARVSSLKEEERGVSSSSPDAGPSSPNLKVPKETPLATTPASPCGNILDMQGRIAQTPTTATSDGTEADSKQASENLSTDPINAVTDVVIEAGHAEVMKLSNEDNDENNKEKPTAESASEDSKNKEYINSVGVRFTHQNSEDVGAVNSHQPYGLPCIYDLFHFLILLCNPLDKQNTDTMMHMGLSLLTVALEVGATSIGKYDILLALVKDEMCRNLFSLLNTERLSIFAADLQVCFLLFESLRKHLKFHLEFYLTKLSEIIASENPRIPYEMRELALDNLLQLWRIPGFVGELYINYDCNLYCTDLFETLTKLLSKNTLTPTTSFYSTHILSMDVLVSVLESIEQHCTAAKVENSSQSDVIVDVENSNCNDSNTVAAEEESTAVTVKNITAFINTISLIGEKRSTENAISISKEQLADLKNKKRIIAQGTELFNQRPEKGIQLLQENGILNSVLDPSEIAIFLRENPGLDKKMIGEYISKRKNVETKILDNFVKSFDFAGLRIDQALRLYLETFRLPGEAPLIFLVMEHFADHWHKCNNEPFANTDAAFRLSYAIIMLNMDQHNHNAKRLNVPMNPEDFQKNLRGLNGNNDFDQDMLLKIFESIQSEEIVMPAEQTGIVRENYLWKVLLRRGEGKDGEYLQMKDNSHDKEIFDIMWGPTLSALSFVFDKSNEHIYNKAIAGFKKCSSITAYYNLHEDFDALILTLCKFTTLLNVQPDVNEITLSVAFGSNAKAQVAMKSVFNMIHEHGDCMRESWKHILEIVAQLFRLSLLPKSLMEVEDFCETAGKATLILEKPSQKTEAGLFSSLYSYLSSDGQRQPTYDELEIIKLSKKCVKECQIDQLVSESKFLQLDSLQELLKSVLNLINTPNSHKSVGLPYAEDVTVFFMEFLVRVVIQNRDRMLPLWSLCTDKMYQLLMTGSSCGYDYLLIRSTVALLKLAIYLMRNEELCPIVLQSLRMLLMLKPNVINRISKQISTGMYELLKTSAQNIHTETDWQIIFTMLECVGAAATPPEFEDAPPPVGTKSDGALSSEEDSGLPDRGYISDSEVVNTKSAPNSSSSTPFISPNGENWILVNKDAELSATLLPQSPVKSTLVYSRKLLDHSPFALFKCWDSLGFIVRNAAHITPYSLQSCVRCIRTFVEVCLHGDKKGRKRLHSGKHLSRKRASKEVKTKKREEKSSDSEDEELVQQYDSFAAQLLYLMYTLYTRIGKIFQWWADEGYSISLWTQGWCPLLQGIARLAVDRRRDVRISAIQYLQSALMNHDLNTLTGPEWASCFKQVFFPLLSELLSETLAADLDPNSLEESRVRTATIMPKVFLCHLTPLIALPSFTDLWIEILDFIEKYMKIGSDMLYDAMLESLKNMLLVMHSIQVFHCNDGTTHSPLWDLTWKRIEVFLPNLKAELFHDQSDHQTENESFIGQIQSQAALHEQCVIVNNDMYAYPQQPKTESGKVSDTTCKNVPAVEPSSLASLVPISSTKSSIILQPPTDGQTIFQSSSATLPIVIPVANTTSLESPPISQTSALSTLNSAFVVNNPYSYSSSPVHIVEQNLHKNLYPTQFYNQPYTSQVDQALPDIVNSSTIHKISEGSTSTSAANIVSTVKPTDSPRMVLYQVRNNSEFSNVIELPDTPPPPQVGYSLETGGMQSSTNYQPHEKMNEVLDNSTMAQTVHSTVHNYQPVNTTDDVDTQPTIPISHIFVGNQYPSLRGDPPTNIVQSFAPVYVQPQAVQSGQDIYMDYVQNPYNLTLQQEVNMQASSPSKCSSDVSNPPQHDQQQQQQPMQTDMQSQIPTQAHTMGSSNMFQSANYFGGVDESTIPPGSEVFFGQP